MDFRIAQHAGGREAPPQGSLELLFEQIGRRRGQASFRLAEGEIIATYRGEESVSSTQDERTEIGRRAILEIVQRACKGTPELDVGWFAISPRRR